MDFGPQLTIWTIRLALALLVLGVVGKLRGIRSRFGRTMARWLWTSGWVLALIHMACAFQFYHHWSHEEAFQDTALQTKNLMGFEFGGGIYFNYAFIAVWGVDVIWSWLAATSYSNRSLVWTVALWGFLVFMAFNSTVVFETGPVRYFGVMATGILCVLYCARRRGKRGKI